jgi:hypothetical protein
MQIVYNRSGWKYKTCERCDDSADGEATYQFPARPKGNGLAGIKGYDIESYYYCQSCFEWMHEHYTVDEITGNLSFPE